MKTVRTSINECMMLKKYSDTITCLALSLFTKCTHEINFTPIVTAIEIPGIVRGRGVIILEYIMML